MDRSVVRPVVAGLVVLATVTVLAMPAGAADRSKVRRPGPLRVLLIGDSITYNYEFAAEAQFAAKGYQTVKMGIASSSLLDSGICNGAFARNLLAFVDPDFVVYENNGNYANRPNVPPCKTLVYGSEAFFRRWKNAAATNQRTLMRKGARFLWIQAPSVNFAPKRAAVPRINAIYRELAATKPTQVTAIDAWTAFGGATFDQTLRYDNQHLNQAGAQRLASLVVAAVG
jgi:lysophospholipase L1-like esterase